MPIAAMAPIRHHCEADWPSLTKPSGIQPALLTTMKTAKATAKPGSSGARFSLEFASLWTAVWWLETQATIAMMGNSMAIRSSLIKVAASPATSEIL
ncbi:hypothetical protein D9M68_790430 [compost metagenome]